MLWRLQNGEFDGIHPKLVVPMIGTNNTGAGDPAPWTAAGVRKVVDTIPAKLPASKLLLPGIFPRGTGDSDERRRNADVNIEPARLGDGNMIRYVDINRTFLTDAGEIPPDVMPDLLHPGGKGYALWYDAMQPALAEMMR